MNSMIGRSPTIAAPIADAGEAALGDRRVDARARSPNLLEHALGLTLYAPW